MFSFIKKIFACKQAVVHDKRVSGFADCINFEKMHGLGNDFIVIDLTRSTTRVKRLDYKNIAPQLCNRKIGVGADGIILICTSDTTDLRMRIINSDGTEAEMCGNGLRCLGKYAYEHNLVSERRFLVETAAGDMTVDVFPKDDNSKLTNDIFYDDDKLKEINKGRESINLNELSQLDVRINMGVADFACSRFPMIHPTGLEDFIRQKVSVGGRELICTAVLVGVPHLVVEDTGLSEGELARLGGMLEKHSMFPRGTNVDFMRVLGDGLIAVRTWERGCGRTLACGTGACAAAVAYAINDVVAVEDDTEVEVKLNLGVLNITVGNDLRVLMRGVANTAYSGKIDIGWHN